MDGGNTENPPRNILESHHPLEPENFHTHLTPLEHALMQSTIKAPDGTSLNQVAILNSDEAFVTTALGVSFHEVDAETIRVGRQGRYLIGSFPVFELDPELLPQGYEQVIPLPEIGQDGRIRSEFTVYIVKYDLEKKIYSLVRDQNIIDRLKVREGIKDRVSLSSGEGNSLRLSFHAAH